MKTGISVANCVFQDIAKASKMYVKDPIYTNSYIATTGNCQIEEDVTGNNAAASL